jgi:hypothetical protein
MKTIWTCCEWSAVAVRLACRTLGLFLAVSAVAGTAFADPSHCAPEIDPGSAASALTLLTGGVLLLTDRLRRRRSS